MKKSCIYLLTLLILFGSCRSSRPLTSTEKAGIGAEIGSFFGWLFGRAVGESIDGGRGEDIGGALGYMAGGIAGSTIAYNKSEREKAARAETARNYPAKTPAMSIPLLNIESCFAGNDDTQTDAPIVAGEEGWISFLIVNNGNYAALDVRPTVKLERGGSGIELVDVGPIGDIPARSSLIYSVPIATSPKLRDGKKVVVSIQLKEGKGYDMEKRKFTLKVSSNR